MIKKILLGLSLFVFSLMFVLPTTITSSNVVSLSAATDGGEGGGEIVTPPEDEEEETTTDKLTPEQIEILKKYMGNNMNNYSISPTSQMTDTNLYKSLLLVFEDFLLEEYGIEYSAGTIYRNMFIDVEEIVIDDTIISSLEGLELLEFTKLKTLKITRNKLTSLNENNFNLLKMPVIENLDFSGNSIKSVKLGKIPTLKSLNLSKNELSEIDLTTLKVEKLNLNVAQNKFKDISKIKMEGIKSIEINLINNSIEDVNEDYFNKYRLVCNNGEDGHTHTSSCYESVYKLSIGIQSLSAESTLVLNTAKPLKYYKTLNNNLKLKIFKENGVYVKTISDADVLEGNNYVNIDLPIGEYYFEYILGDEVAQKFDDPSRLYFETGELTILPANCTFKYEFKGEIYDTFEKKVTGKVKVMLSAEEGATIMYKVNSGDWVEGNEVMCDEGGNYTIYTKVIKDGMESEVKSILVRTSQNVIIPDFVMLVLILLFTIALFMVVVPFISKKFFR